MGIFLPEHNVGTGMADSCGVPVVVGDSARLHRKVTPSALEASNICEDAFI